MLQKNRIDDVHYDLVHRSLLAGLPTNVGTKGEEPSASGSGSASRNNKQLKSQMIGMRNRNFFIFPGSALFKKPPEWIMTFALVETTRLYARIAAGIDPAWVNQVACDVQVLPRPVGWRPRRAPGRREERGKGPLAHRGGSGDHRGAVGLSVRGEHSEPTGVGTRGDDVEDHEKPARHRTRRAPINHRP